MDGITDYNQAYHFNPRSPRGLRPLLPKVKYQLKKISIHAAQEGCDLVESCKHKFDLDISIHAAQEGCDTGN